MDAAPQSLSQLQSRLRRVHAALASTSTFSIPTFKSVPVTGSPERMHVEFRDHRSESELANLVASLLASIGSIKDHLNLWCAANGVSAPGDALINSNLAVALVHDLWNRDKHGALTWPRSGFQPYLSSVEQSLVVEPVNGAGSTLDIRLDTATGEARAFPGPNTRLSLVVDGEILDESGKPLGSLLSICNEAVDAWLDALEKAGVPLC